MDVDGVGRVGCACGVDSCGEGDGEDVAFVVVRVLPDEVDSAGGAADEGGRSAPG